MGCVSNSCAVYLTGVLSRRATDLCARRKGPPAALALYHYCILSRWLCPCRLRHSA